MSNFDSVEKLRDRANVTYEDAKVALDACGGDLLDALIYLEKQGKVAEPGGGSYSSKSAPADNAIVTGQPQKAGTGDTFGSLVKKFFAWCGRAFHCGNTNYFEVHRKGEKILTVPVTLLVILLLVSFWATIPLLLVGLFLDCRYSFRGAQVEKIDMNGVMDSAADAADKIKNEVKAAHEGCQRQNGHTEDK